MTGHLKLLATTLIVLGGLLTGCSPKQAIALGAMWDPALVEEISCTISDEARARWWSVTAKAGTSSSISPTPETWPERDSAE